jgi:uncharacterized protein
MGNKQGDFIWYELMTPDLEGARAFYEAVVGWTISTKSDFSHMDYRLVRWGEEQSGAMMGLNDDMIAHGAKPFWAAYIAVDDVDATAAAIEAKGGHLFIKPSDIPGVGRFAFCGDPQGAPFYIMKDTSGATSTVFADKQVGHWGWNELWVPDTKAAIDFYTSLFGWEQQGAMPMGPRGDYLFLQSNGQPIGAVGPVSDPAKGAYWRHVFRVPSIGTALEAAKAHGATDIEGPHQVPGDDYVMYAKDPQGAAFVLVGGQ